MIHHAVAVILEVSAKELHNYTEASMLIIDPFGLLIPAQTSACGTKEMDWLQVRDTECH
jgi:hypothetical protein